MPAVTAIVAAGGSASRMGFDKLTAALDGIPVLARTVAALRTAPDIGDIVVAAPAARADDYAALLAAHVDMRDVQVVPGGGTRQASVAAALAALPAAPDFVLIHDGARPLVTRAVIGRALAAVYGGDGGVAAAVGVSDTLKAADGAGFVTATVPRERLWAVQTPQVFAYTAYRRALALAEAAGAAYTDDCQLFEAAGYPVRLVEGDARNLKLTVAADFALAAALLRLEET